jgi:hypothetical protein
MLSAMLCMATALTVEGADNQNAAGTYGFESVQFGTTFDKANAYIQAKFAANDIITKTDSIKKARTILIEGYEVSGITSFKVDAILSFDRNDVFFKCELEGPNRSSDPKLVAADASSFLDMLKKKYGGKYRQETVGGQRLYWWSLGTTQVSLTMIQSTEFQFAKVSVSEVSLLTKQDDYEKAEAEKTKRLL